MKARGCVESHVGMLAKSCLQLISFAPGLVLKASPADAQVSAQSQQTMLWRGRRGAPRAR